MLQSKKEKYILVGLVFILLAALVWRVSLHQARKSAQPVRLRVLAAKGSETEYGDLMAGIRDYARENDVEIRVFYQETQTTEALETLLSTEENKGIHGILLLHPEDFLDEDTGQQVTAELPTMRIGGETITALSDIPAVISRGDTDNGRDVGTNADDSRDIGIGDDNIRDMGTGADNSRDTGSNVFDREDIDKSLSKTDIQELLEGKRTYVTVVNEYEVGYIAAKTVAEASGKSLEDIDVEALKMTAEDLISGKYNTLFGD